jgi:hypothetical protein
MRPLGKAIFGSLLFLGNATCSRSGTSIPSDTGSDGGKARIEGGVAANSRDAAEHDAEARDPASGPKDPDITAMLSAIAPNRIALNILQLVSYGTRNSCSDASGLKPGIGAARDWIRAQLSAIPGLQVMLHQYAQPRCGPASVPRHNVVAWIPGTSATRLVVIGGHYDSRTITASDGLSPAPGANDSGSQTSLVLEAARVMAGHTFRATVVFVAFAGEEQGLVGSSALAGDIQRIFPGADVDAMLNCDIVGGDNTVNLDAALHQFRLYSPGTPREIRSADGTTDDTSPSRGLMRYVATWGGTYVPDMAIIPKLREDRPGRGGDHESFIAAGHPGVRFIEPIENLAHEHTGQDLFDFVTPSYTTRVAEVVVAVAASLARAPSPPTSLVVSGNASSANLSFLAPADDPVDHYVVAARPASENFYHSRRVLPATTTTGSFAPSDLSVDPGTAYYVSVAAVDAGGHESTFAYPEYRCDESGCVVPPDALDVTARN